MDNILVSSAYYIGTDLLFIFLCKSFIYIHRAEIAGDPTLWHTVFNFGPF